MDHTTEVMNLGRQLFAILSALRPLPFSLADLLVVLFLHDLEKPHRYANAGLVDPSLETKEQRHAWRLHLLVTTGLDLTDEQNRALRLVEGEMGEYSSSHRAMNELGALCHACDVLSARLWHDRPLPVGEEIWGPGRHEASRVLLEAP